MTPDQLINLFQTDLIPLLIKGSLLFIVFLYSIFAAVILRQVQIMNKVVTEANFSPVLFTVALFHLIAAVSLFALIVVFL